MSPPKNFVSGMLANLRKLRTLRLSQLRLLAVCCVLVPIVDISLRLFGMRRTQGLLARFVEIPRHARTGAELEPLEIGWLVSIAATHSLWPASCLRQALVLWWLLARRGISTHIRLGVSKDSGGALAAHAWVEHDGHILIGGEASRERYQVVL